MYVDFKLAEKNYNNYYCNDDGIRMSLYLELRANDYTNFITLNDNEQKDKMIIFEYLSYWLGSFSV